MSFRGFTGGGNISYARPIYGHYTKKGRWRMYGSVPEFMKTYGGLQWTEIRKVLSDAFVNPKNDPRILGEIMRKVMPIVPVRSGYMLDFILKSLKISRRAIGHVHHFFGFSWNFPRSRRPYPCGGRVAHSPPEEGYGEWRNVRLTHFIPNVHVKRVTPDGNALYSLDDPSSIHYFADIINRTGQQEIIKDLNNRFGRIRIQLTFPYVIGSGQPLLDTTKITY